MILSRCPITGLELKLDSRFPGTAIKVTSLHPLLCAEPEQLTKLQPQSEEDSRLLFLSLCFKLHELNFLEFTGTPSFPARWMSQELHHLQTFVIWANINSTNVRKDLLPIFRLSPQTSAQNFQAWRQECESLVASWDTMLDASIARHIKREREAALALLNTPITLQPKIARSPRVSRAQARLSFVRDSLESFSDKGQSLIDFYLKILSAPHTYEVVQLQRAKDCFLDYLPDSSIEDYNDKDTCLRILDAAIMEKVGLANMLGIGICKESQEIVDNIRAENSHYADGKRFTTTVNTKLNSAMQFLENRKESIIPEVTVPTSEPKREDYASELGYKVALRVWTKSQTVEAK